MKPEELGVCDTHLQAERHDAGLHVGHHQFIAFGCLNWRPIEASAPVHNHTDACYGRVPETEGTGEYLRCGQVAGVKEASAPDAPTACKFCDEGYPLMWLRGKLKHHKFGKAAYYPCGISITALTAAEQRGYERGKADALAQDEASEPVCGTCKGRKFVTKFETHPKGGSTWNEPCPTCGGTGKESKNVKAK